MLYPVNDIFIILPVTEASIKVLSRSREAFAQQSVQVFCLSLGITYIK